MFSHVTGSIDREVAPPQEQLKAGADHWLSLAAAPTFAMMALLTRVHGGSMPGMLCSAGQDAWLLSGMVPMYWLMSAFHMTPWLRLLSRRRNGAGRSSSRLGRAE